MRPCVRKHQVASWRVAEQYRPVLQPEHSCRCRPASVAADNLRQLRTYKGQDLDYGRHFARKPAGHMSSLPLRHGRSAG